MKKTPWFWILPLALASLWYVQQSDGPSSVPAFPHSPATPSLTKVLPGHLSYPALCQQLAQWHQEAPGLTELGTYGQSSQGKPLTYLRLTNLSTRRLLKPQVLITAGLHGNEPLGVNVVLGVMGRLLSQYKQDAGVTSILDTRDIYFIPVVSPDSYPSSRQVDGVDPNRDFPGPSRPDHQSTPSIAALQSFYKQHAFQAVISGHTYGRVFLFPYGDTTQPSPDDAALKDLFTRMGQLAQYNAKHACELYQRPITGSEVDWYYRTSHACACVMEMGTSSVGGQRPARPEEIKSEMERTWPAFILFLKEAPLLLDPPRNLGGRGRGSGHAYWR